MKLILPLLFLCISSYSQTFMTKMDVIINKIDTTIVFKNETVIWGLKDEEFCFSIEGKDICFWDFKTTKPPKNVIKFVRKHKGSLSEYKPGNKDYLKFKRCFYNRWGETYLITIYIHNGFMIFIVRLDGNKLPNYYLSSSPISHLTKE